MSMKPLQLAFYKGVGGKFGAVQFGLQRPHYYLKTNPKLKNYEGRFIPSSWKDLPDFNPNSSEEELVSREGAVFLEITSASDKNVYDWSRKVVMALSIQDTSEILMVLEGQKSDCSLMHDPGAKSASQGKVNKKLSFSSPKGIKEGCLINASESKAGGETVKHMVPLSGAEAKRLAILLRHSIPAALAW